MLIDMAVRDLFGAALGGGSGGGGGGLFSWLGGLFGFANGGVFSGGHVQAFARGGIVNSPTLFPMANGAGLMGEAGPEAIMPLRRGPDGRLGVSAANSNQVGGGQSVVIIRIDDGLRAEIVQQAAGQAVQVTRGMVEPVSRAVDQMAQQQRYG